MALGQHIADRAVKKHERVPGDPKYCDSLCGSRISIALLSSLLIPALFFFSAPVIGNATAFLGAVFLLLSPYHIFTSRLAHLDAPLALFTLLSVFLYIRAVQREQISLKLAAALSFGLAIATKPTAALVLPALVLYKPLRNLLVNRTSTGERPLLTWSDLWTLLISLATLSFLYTRFWTWKSGYASCLKIRPAIIPHLKEIAGFLEESLLPVLLVGVVTLAFGVWAFSLWRARNRETSPPVRYHFLMAVSFCGTVAALFMLFPAVFANQIRFWTWVVSLQKHPFDAGESWNPFPYGYPGILAMKIPEAFLILIALGTLFILLSPLRQNREAGERRAFWLLCVLLIAFWIVPLNKSPKQDMRYLLPILPLLYLIAARGMTSLFCWIPNTFARTAFLSLPCIYLAWLLTQLHPAYSLHFNSVTGGLEEAKQQRLRFNFAGYTEAVDFMKRQAAERYANMDIGVLIDGETTDVFKTSYLRGTPPGDRRFLFEYRDETRQNQLFDAQYWVALGLFDDQLVRKRQIEAITGPLNLIYTYSVRDTELLQVFEIPPYHFRVPLEFPIHLSASHAGTVIWPQNSSGTEGAIEAFPGQHEAGYLFLGNVLRLPPGIYEVEYDLDFPGAQISPAGKAPVALTVQLSGECREVIRVPEKPPFTRRFRLRCVLTGPRKAGPSGYWPEKAAVRISRLSISRQDLRSPQ
jgi:4-amino-4-deoxy-L-arabinose transferase-like glycosyltransferase